MSHWPALTYLLEVHGRLYDEERKELLALLDRVRTLEKVNEAAEKVVDILK